MKRLLPPLALLFLTSTFSFAGSASWKPHPVSSDWNNAANWRPRTIPNGPSDIATFGVSDTTDVSLPTIAIELNGIVFNPGASAFTVIGTNAIDQSLLTFNGAGITNNSGLTQTFVTNSTWIYGLVFQNQATAGINTVLSVQDSSVSGIAFYDEASAGSARIIIPGNGDFGDGNPAVDFYQSATADHSTIIANGGSGDHGEGAAVVFYDTSTAANAILTITGATDPTAGGGILIFEGSSTAGASIITNEGTSIDAGGGGTRFADDATAGSATITADGAGGPDGFPATVVFEGNSNAEDATLIANGSSNAGAGALIEFLEYADGSTARVELFGNGTLDLSNLSEKTFVNIGSLEGDGIVSLGSDVNYFHFLNVGANNLTTVFSGVIQGSGPLTKVGSGTLTLAGANTYTGYTSVSNGFLRVENRTGSATGSGNVSVGTAGTLGGGGTIAGHVQVAYGIIAPGTGVSTLTVKKSLSWYNAQSVYLWRVKTSSRQSDKVVAGAVNLYYGPTFSGKALGNAPLPLATVFTAIDNTSADPINGTFGNLPDGGTIRIGNNTYQANYEGGDGNDLTLTVVQ